MLDSMIRPSATIGWGAAILAILAALLDAVGLFPDGSAASIIARYGGIVTALVSGLARSSSLGEFKAPRWFNLLGVLATVLGTLAVSLQSDPAASAIIGPTASLWINAIATFVNRFAHSIAGPGDNSK